MLPNPADAEDAFQATFLALVQSVQKLGRVKSVGGWLHGVAVKVCLKARRSAARRKVRDERSARPEAAPAEPQWDDLHTAVHEEIEKLPAMLRAVFVLCELEGVRQPDAAARLGCKLGTVSGRLTRARQSLLKSLSARGLAPAAAVGVMAIGGSAAAVPMALMEKALAVARAGPAIPSGVLQLAKSVTEGTSMKVKILAAAFAVATGVMTAGGWLTGAMGQPPAPVPVPVAPAADPFIGGEEPPAPARAPQPPRPVDPARPDEPRQPRDPLPPARPTEPAPRDDRDPVRPGVPAPRDGRDPQPREPMPVPAGRPPQQRVEHLLADAPSTKDEIERLIRKHEAAGWEFAGQAGAGKDTQMVFKRPKGIPPGNWGAAQPIPVAPRLPGMPPQPLLPPRGEEGGGRVPRGAGDGVPAPRGEGDRLPPRGRDVDPVPPRREAIPPRDSEPRRGEASFFPPPADLVPPSELPGGEPRSVELLPPALPAARSIPADFTLPTQNIPSSTIPPAVVEETELHVLELKHAQPETLSVLVKKFFPATEISTDTDSGSLVLRCGKKTLDEVKKLVEKLDKPAKNRFPTTS